MKKLYLVSLLSISVLTAAKPNNVTPRTSTSYNTNFHHPEECGNGKCKSGNVPTCPFNKSKQ